MTLGKGRYRNALTVAFIAIMLFNYANATLFWHCHKTGSSSVTHSHIYWKGHVAGESSGGHTPGELQIIDIICHALYTADILPQIHIDREDVLEWEFSSSVFPEEAAGFSEIISLRGPPRLV